MLQDAKQISQVAHFLLKAKDFYENGLFHEAKKSCERALAIDPNNFQALLVLGTIALNSKHFEIAKKILDKAIQLNQSSPIAYSHQGIVLQNLQRYEAALDHHDKAIAIQAHYPEVFNNRGITLTDLNQFDAAIESFRIALKQKPAYAEAHNNLGYAYFCYEQYESALEEYDLATQISPSYPTPHKNRGDLFKKLGKSDLALNAYTQSILLNPSSASLWRSKAECLLAIGAYQESIDCIKTSIAFGFNQIKLNRNPGQGARSSDMPIEDAASALLDLKILFDQHQIVFFLAYGTLLGIYRDGDLMKHDKDLDVGLFDGVNREKINLILAKSDIFEIKDSELQTSETKRYHLTVKHLKTNALIDLFFFVPDGEFLLSGFDKPHYPLLWRFSKFELSTIKYRNHSFQIPEDPERFFSEIYGPGWRIPDPYFDSVLSGHNLVKSSRLISLSYGLFRLANNLDNTNWKKAFGYCQQIFVYEREPWLEEIAKWLELRLEQAKLAPKTSELAI